jgi:superfamily II DNA or RNA helicase
METIIEKRQLVLREYQIPESDYIMEHDVVVLGMAPNGGKTEIAIDVIERYLNLNPQHKVLVLTHSTNVLLDNFHERLSSLNVKFAYSDKCNPQAQVHLMIPQNEHKIKGHYDFLIVDEAHENYLAKRVQGIIKKTTPTKQLLLTGTPSPFIKRKDMFPNIRTVALNDLPDEYRSKLNVELAVVNYEWTKNDYNNYLELKSDIKIIKKETKEAMGIIIEQLIDRLRKKFTPEQFNQPGWITKIKSTLFNYNNLGRTLFVCKSINQSNDVYEVLKDMGISCMVSNSVGDVDSEQIKRFKNGDFDVLIVVDRARLGYNDDGLYNLVDMSGTHSPNMIYQMFSRVIRGTQNDTKFYLKITSQSPGMMDLTNASVCAALMLTDNKFISTYNGDNFNGIMVPILKNIREEHGSSGGGGSKKENRKIVFPEFTSDVIELFRNIIHSLDKPVSIYKAVTLGEVKDRLSGKIFYGDFTDEELIETGRGNVTI